MKTKTAPKEPPAFIKQIRIPKDEQQYSILLVDKQSGSSEKRELIGFWELHKLGIGVFRWVEEKKKKCFFALSAESLQVTFRPGVEGIYSVRDGRTALITRTK